MSSLKCHRERMKPKYSLEDYIHEMESRSLQQATEEEELDVYQQLHKKEKDLILAAELGKALLEKNEELSRKNERIAEEYSQKLEALEQDRHLLKRKLETVRSEYDIRITELQADIRELSRSLTERESVLKQSEKEKAALITELTEQNDRLTSQLKESCNMEEQLTNQIQILRDQCNEKKSSLQDHVNSIEILREEINMMSEKKTELERRMQTLLQEREALNSGLDDATYKIISLEHQIREQELQLRQCQREVMELHELNSMLGSQVETLANKVQSNNHSLLQEMECDDMSHTNESYKLKEEALSVYQQLQLIYDHLTHYRRINSSFSEMTSETVPLKEETLQTFKVGLLSETTQNLSTLVNQVLNQRSGRDQNSTDRSVELDGELLRTHDTMNTLQSDLDKKIEELKQQTEVVVDLTSKLTIREAELASVTEERDQARADLMDTYLAQDEVVQKAREARDKAMSRKNMVEIQLAKTRVEMMQTSSQLMEAIQQKVGLSQQLEEWQTDMQCLLDYQLKHKLTNQEQMLQSNHVDPESLSYTGSSSTEKKNNSSLKIFSLFQR